MSLVLKFSLFSIPYDRVLVQYDLDFAVFWLFMEIVFLQSIQIAPDQSNRFE